METETSFGALISRRRKALGLLLLRHQPSVFFLGIIVIEMDGIERFDQGEIEHR